jgi:hypothetical protein
MNCPKCHKRMHGKAQRKQQFGDYFCHNPECDVEEMVVYFGGKESKKRSPRRRQTDV